MTSSVAGFARAAGSVRGRRGLTVLVALAVFLQLVGAAGPSVGHGAAMSESQAVASMRNFTAVRSYVNLNGAWKFYRGSPGNDASGRSPQAALYADAAWTTVTVPHTWNAVDGQTSTSPGRDTYYRGDGWYRRHVTVPPSAAGKKVYVEFDAVNQVADVFVNGSSVGRHIGGFAKFRYDITPYARIGGDNVIAVKANNAASATVAPYSADYTSFGGIYRDTQLVVVDPLQLDAMDRAGKGLYVDTISADSRTASIRVRVKVANRTNAPATPTVEVSIFDRNNVRVSGGTCSAMPGMTAGSRQTCTLNLTIASPARWSPSSPQLYRAEASVRLGTTVRDAEQDTFGIRVLDYDADNGLLVNGSSIRVRGVNKHQDRLGQGWVTTTANERQDFDLMAEMGANAIRTAHYQMSDFFYEQADKRGFLVWTELPNVNYTPTGDAFTAYRNNLEESARELLTQLHNRPSFAVLSVGNEQPASSTNPNITTLVRSLNTLVNDSANWGPRITGYASNQPDGDPVYAITELSGHNKYYGWYMGKAAEFASWMDWAHTTWPARRLVVTEYGAGASIRHQRELPTYGSRDDPANWGLVVGGGIGTSFHPEGYQAYYHERYWNALSTRKFMNGSFVWNMFDFASSRRNEGDTVGRNDKGLVTFDRVTRKDAFYFYKTVWTSTPVVRIVGRRHVDRPDTNTNIKVYSNQPGLTLSVAGVTVAAKPMLLQTGVYVWDNVCLPPDTTVTVSAAAGSVRDTATWTTGSGPSCG
jgi:beta-galactosidase